MSETLKSPRIRFNWGFHDGASDAARNTFKPGGILSPSKPHFDQVYEKGYRAGHAAAKAGESTESSAPAWETRCTCPMRFGWHGEKCRAKAAAVRA